MTIQRGHGSPASHLGLPPLPDPPKKSDLQENLHFDRPAVANTLARHLGALRPDATTLVAGRGYLCRRRSDLPSCPYPDLIVAFDVAASDIAATNGYVISEVGKPPDLVMEVASSRTARNDYVRKREIYASLGVTEYWRDDPTGGRYYSAALAGDRRTPQGGYQPMETTAEADGVIWGYSEVLGLSLCWAERHLRFWSRASGQYLLDPPELEDALRLSEGERAAEHAARLLEQTAREAAERRIRQLEEELNRRQNP